MFQMSREETQLNLVEVEDQIQLTDVAEEMVQYLHKQMNAFKIGQLVVCDINAHWKEKASITSINDLVCSELFHNMLNENQRKINEFHFTQD